MMLRHMLHMLKRENLLQVLTTNHIGWRLNTNDHVTKENGEVYG